MVPGKKNIFNKHISTSHTSSSTQRTTHPAKIKPKQPGQRNFRQGMSKSTGTVSKATKRRSQIYLNETESQDDETHREDFNLDSQYLFHPNDVLNDAIGTDGEPMQGVEMPKLEMDNVSNSDNVFLSLIQDFGEKRLKETWVTVGSILRTYRMPRIAQPPLTPQPLGTQFIVILKGIGVNTYQCLKNNLQEKDNSVSTQSLTRTYLSVLRSAKVDYVDTKDSRKCTVGKQNIPLVYGDYMLGSEKWVIYRENRDRRRTGQEAHDEAGDSMDGVLDGPVVKEVKSKAERRLINPAVGKESVEESAGKTMKRVRDSEDDVEKSFERPLGNWQRLSSLAKQRRARAEKSKRSTTNLLNSKTPSLLKLRK
jgi:hypothetical protein